MATDYYQTLGISKSASAEDIKRAYRKLAHQHHPDKAGGNEAKFKEINEAYQILSDDKKRAQYDAYGSAGPSFNQQSAGFDFGGFSQGFEGINVEDIFDMFGGGFGGRTSARETRGQDIAVDITLTLPEVLLGGKKVFEIEKYNVCQTCRGSGAKSGADLVKCSTCDGRGQMREQVGILFGSFTRVVECSVCQGTGKVPKEKCGECKGEGRRRGRERIEFDIPSGVQHGATIAMRGKGQAGFRGAPSGDLHMRITIAMPHKLSRRARELVEELAGEL